jgi:hypothetical protein
MPPRPRAAEIGRCRTLSAPDFEAPASRARSSAANTTAMRCGRPDNNLIEPSDSHHGAGPSQHSNVCLAARPVAGFGSVQSLPCANGLGDVLRPDRGSLSGREAKLGQRPIPAEVGYGERR